MNTPFEAHTHASHFPKIPSQGFIFEPQDDCHLRGVSGNAQDTTPVRGSFCCEIKTLFSPCGVDGLSTDWDFPKKLNKNNAGCRHV